MRHLLIVVFLLSTVSYAQEDCEEKSLMPYLYAHMCLPDGAQKQPAETSVAGCDDYPFVSFDVVIGEYRIKIREQKECEKGVLRALYNHEIKDYQRKRYTMEEKDSNMIVIRHSTGSFTIHSFRNPSGWPYYITCHLLCSDAELQRMKAIIRSIRFDTPDKPF